MYLYILGTRAIHKIFDTLVHIGCTNLVLMNNLWSEIQPLDWPHDTNLMRYENYSVATEEIVVHALRSFDSKFAQGIIYFMNSLGTEDDVYNDKSKLRSVITGVLVFV